MTKVKSTKKQTHLTNGVIKYREELEKEIRKQIKEKNTRSAGKAINVYLRDGIEYEYLMLVGGLYEDVEENIKHIKKLNFGEVVSLSCKDRDDNELKKEIDEFIRYKDYISFKNHIDTIPLGLTKTILERLGHKRDIDVKEIKDFLKDYKLLILKNVSSTNEDIWHNFVEAYYDKLKPDFLIATVQSKEELGKLPKPWCGLFDIISLDGKETIVEPVAEIAEPEASLEGKRSKGVVDQVYKKEIQKIIPFTQKDINWKNVKWEDIKMVIRERTKEIDISVGDKKPLNYQYSQMGFKYQEKNKPKKAWLMFLCLAKTDNNTLNYKIIKNTTKYMKLQAFQDRISEIRNNIKCVFPKLTGDPIPHTGKIGYKPQFRIYIIADSTSSNEVGLDSYNYQSETIVEQKNV